MKKMKMIVAVILTTVITGCAGSNAGGSKGCSIEGTTTFKEYTNAYLLDSTLQCLDSIRIAEDGSFCFAVADSVSKPYFVTVRLSKSLKSDDWMDMPVIVENGTVRLALGEYIHTSGTPLNLGMQEFLDGLQHVKDGILAQDSIKIEEIKPLFSSYYKQQILANRGNALGDYILQQYGSNLTDADKEELEQLK